MVVVLPVPIVTRYRPRNEVVVGRERMEPFPTQIVSRVTWPDVDLLQALADFEVFSAAGILSADAWVMDSTLDEPFQRLTAEHVTGAAAHVALLHVWPEPTAEVDRLVGVLVLEHVPDVLDDHVRIVIGLHEPVGVIEVVPMDKFECCLRLAPQEVIALGNVEPDCRKRPVGSGTHEEYDIAALAPSRLDVLCLRLDAARARHHPTQDPDLLLQLRRDCVHLI